MAPQLSLDPVLACLIVLSIAAGALAALHGQMRGGVGARVFALVALLYAGALTFVAVDDLRYRRDQTALIRQGVDRFTAHCMIEHPSLGRRECEARMAPFRGPATVAWYDERHPVR